MKKILLILAAVIGIVLLVWLLSYVIGFIWELFWVIVVIVGCAGNVKIAEKRL